MARWVHEFKAASEVEIGIVATLQRLVEGAMDGGLPSLVFGEGRHINIKVLLRASL